MARAHLAPREWALISSGDLGHLRRPAAEEGFQGEVAAQGEVTQDGQRVDYFAPRLRPSWGHA
ncbi:MAG: hypothetical protein ACYCS9_09790 [Candidatus Dormibacteria bacterium]